MWTKSGNDTVRSRYSVIIHSWWNIPHIFLNHFFSWGAGGWFYFDVFKIKALWVALLGRRLSTSSLPMRRQGDCRGFPYPHVMLNTAVYTCSSSTSSNIHQDGHSGEEANRPKWEGTAWAWQNMRASRLTKSVKTRRPPTDRRRLSHTTHRHTHGTHTHNGLYLHTYSLVIPIARTSATRTLFVRGVHVWIPLRVLCAAGAYTYVVCVSVSAFSFVFSFFFSF